MPKKKVSVHAESPLEAFRRDERKQGEKYEPPPVGGLGSVHRNVLEGLYREFYQGRRVQLFHAILYCGRYGVPLPAWATFEMERAFKRYTSAEVETLDDAFNIRRRDVHVYRKMPAEQDRVKKAWPVFQEVERRRAGGEGLGPELYELVGREFKIGGRTARRYYEDVRKTLYPENSTQTLKTERAK